MIRSRSRRRSAELLLVVSAMVAQACGEPSKPTVPESPASSQPVANASTTPFEATAYPVAGDAPCNQQGSPDATHAAYTGSIRRIRAIDAQTVEFQLCAPDVAFRTRLAFTAFAIDDSAWLQAHIDPGSGTDQAIVQQVNGTGPYRLESWNRGSEISLVRNDSYWGLPARSERVVIRWRDDAAGRLGELQAGSVDGIDDVGPGGADTIANDVSLQAVPRAGLNVFYVGFNNTFAPFDNPKVRQAIAMGIDRDRIVQAFYPPGSEVATHFSPCAVPNGCGGDPWYEFDPTAARQVLIAAGYRNGFKTTIQYRDVVRPYLPNPTAVALDLQAQLLANLKIQAKLEVLPEDAFLTTVDEGRADGIHLLGRTASIPDAASLLDPHFGAGSTREFGDPVAAITTALVAGASVIDQASRTTAYTQANDAIRTNVPMIPVAHAGSLTAFRADVVGAQSSPVRYERFAGMTPGDRRQFVWLTSTEPEGLYCADETSAVAQLVCSQVSEGLYAFAPGGASVVPALAADCTPNPELTTWTCTLRKGVTFHDGSTLDSGDVVLSFAVQWDAGHPLHRGHQGAFQPFIDVFGGLLNPPR